MHGQVEAVGGVKRSRQVIASFGLYLNSYPRDHEILLLLLSKVMAVLLGPGSLFIALISSPLDFSSSLVSFSYFSMFLLAYHISFIIFPVSWNLFCLKRHWISLSFGSCILLSRIYNFSFSPELGILL